MPAPESYKFRYDRFEKRIQDRWAYHSNGQVEYHGVAKKGKADTDPEWLIERWTYDGSSRPIARKTSDENVVWDNGAGTTYLNATYS